MVSFTGSDAKYLAGHGGMTIASHGGAWITAVGLPKIDLAAEKDRAPIDAGGNDRP